jgi:NitT/TauT family transport system ATP-binding protein
MALIKAINDKRRGQRQAVRREQGGHVRVEDVSIVFETPGQRHVAVESTTLDIEPGEFVCLLGPSGCGKSTLMNAVAGFVRPATGVVTVDGEPVTRPSPKRGMVFQQHSLFPWKTVLRNVMFGPLMAGEAPIGAESTARTFLDMVGLTAFADRFPMTLSGGMQQRVGIARALANYPSVLLMDEPFGALDAQTRSMMQENLLKLWEDFKITVLFVTHDIDEAVFLGDRVVVMSAAPGRIIADFKVDIERPRTSDALLSPEFMRIKKQCMDLIRQESMLAFEQQSRRLAAGE